MRKLLFGALLVMYGCGAFANNGDYLQRQSDYIDSMLQSPSDNQFILQAFRGLPVDTMVLQGLLTELTTNTVADFDIIKLIRLLYLSNGEYENQILPVLDSLPFWINYGDTVHTYWSENHMIMWSSSEWLLHERYGRQVDSSLRQRIVHYLQMKNTFGYYEFFSSVYGPYCLSGILNLADFAQDAEIKQLAQTAAQKLLGELLLLTNNKGVLFPAAGRNYCEKYETPYGQNHNDLIYLLTGLGQSPTSASISGSFLATSALEVDTPVANFNSDEDRLVKIGHPLDTMNMLHAGQTEVNKTVFQWSAGAYFHPDVVLETATLLQDSNMWNHVDFQLLSPLSSIAPQDFPSVSEGLSCISESSVICGESVYVFKKNAITLSSIQDFWKGKVGFQQFPCVANVGTTAVYTASGQEQQDWTARDRNNGNIHLPYVEQKHNVALLMYRPEPTPSLLGNKFTYKDVALHWKEEDFDETDEIDNWLLGREENGYVAVRRSCVGMIDSVQACPTINGQSWVIIVGDSSMYGSFANFTDKVGQAQFTETWSYDSVQSVSNYFAEIIFDTTNIAYTWGVDSAISSINAIDNLAFSLIPNPADNQISIEFPESGSQSYMLQITDVAGRMLLEKNFAGNAVVNTSDFQRGIYFVKVSNRQGESSVRRLLISR